MSSSHGRRLCLLRCERVWSVPVGPGREALCARVRERPGILPLLLPQRIQAAPRRAELRGWVTRWGRGQKLIHGVQTVDLLGYVLAERNVIVKAEGLPAENQSGPGGGGGVAGGDGLEGFDKCEGRFYRLKCNLIHIHLLFIDITHLNHSPFT